MEENYKEKIENFLIASENILVAVNPEAKTDGIAAGLAMLLVLQKLNKNVSIDAQNPTVGDAQRLYAVDKIGKNESSGVLTLVINDAVNNVEKVTHFLDGDKLKVVIHPLSGSLGASESDVSFEESRQNPDLIISIGFKTKEELKEKITLEQQLNSECKIINISLERDLEPFGHANVQSSFGASLSETVGKLLLDLNFPIDEDVAYNLYTGIHIATNGFSPTLASPLSFEIASMLIKLNAGKAGLAQGEFWQKSPSQPVNREEFQQEINYKNISAFNEKPPEEVELEPASEDDWLKPPKIYKGSKSFDKKG